MNADSEKIGAFDIWFERYAKEMKKEYWRLKDAFEAGYALAAAQAKEGK